jgi:peptidoglycan/xylan/chitin deacetylase (PgdA/CDA1 family)
VSLAAWPLRWLFGSLSPAASRARLSILIFHRVLPRTDPLFPDEVDAERFDAICAWLRTWFNVLPLDQACRRLRERTLPARALAITFDDGYADNHDVALPILQRHGLNATFFVATGFLDGGRMWNDTLIEAVRRCPQEQLDLSSLADLGLEGLGRLPLLSTADKRAAIDALISACRYRLGGERDAAVAAVARIAAAELPRDLMMTSEQVRSLHRQGMLIGGHTVNHPILARLALEEARQEIRGGKQQLEALTQAPVTLFAYPNGRPSEDFGAEHAALAEELGFDAAVTTAWGVSNHRSDRFQLPRFTPWDRSRWAFGLRLARNVGVRAPAVRFV